MINNIYDFLQSPGIIDWRCIGSRTIPSGYITSLTDLDIIILTDSNTNIAYKLVRLGFFSNSDDTYGGDSDFISYKKGMYNILVTKCIAFFKKFSLANDLAQLLDIYDKTKRIELFRYVLYSEKPPRLLNITDMQGIEKLQNREVNTPITPCLMDINVK